MQTGTKLDSQAVLIEESCSDEDSCRAAKTGGQTNQCDHKQVNPLHEKGPVHENMPSLEEAHMLRDTQIIECLTSLTNSQYFGVDNEDLTNFIQPSIARRYLYSLIIFNDMRKSNFDPIREVSSSLSEGSSMRDSSDD